MATQPQALTERLTPQQFAGRVRSKYPGAYDDLSDDDLTQRVLAKYPEYSDMVSLTPAAPVAEPEKGPIARFFAPAIEAGKGIYQTVRRNIAAQPGEENLLSRVAGPGPGIVQDVATGLLGAHREAGEEFQREPSVRSFLEAGVPIAGPLHRSLRKKIEGGDVAGALGETALVIAGGRSGGTVKSVQTAAKATVDVARTTVPSRLINSILRTPKVGYRFGRNPGLGVAQEGIVANSEEGLLAGIKARAAQIETRRNTILANAKTHPIDVHKVIKDAVGPEIEHARNVANRSGVEALQNLQADLLARHPQMMNPLETTQLKSELARATNWTSDSTQMILNDGRRRIVNRLRFQVELRVPKVGSLNERWGNLIEAEKALDGAIAIGERKNIVGLGDIAFGTAGGLLGGAAGEPILGTMAGLAARKAVGSTAFKTTAAKALARRKP